MILIVESYIIPWLYPILPLNYQQNLRDFQSQQKNLKSYQYIIFGSIMPMNLTFRFACFASICIFSVVQAF